jgi:hypothetical protein
VREISKNANKDLEEIKRNYELNLVRLSNLMEIKRIEAAKDFDKETAQKLE